MSGKRQEIATQFLKFVIKRHVSDALRGVHKRERTPAAHARTRFSYRKSYQVDVVTPKSFTSGVSSEEKLVNIKSSGPHAPAEIELAHGCVLPATAMAPSCCDAP